MPDPLYLFTNYDLYGTNQGLYCIKRHRYSGKTVSYGTQSFTINNWNVSEQTTDYGLYSNTYGSTTFALEGKTVYNLHLTPSLALVATNEGIYKANTNIDTWSYKGIGCSTYQILTVNNVIYAATENGLFSSTDCGETWIVNAFNGMVINNISVKDNNNLFVCTNSGVFISHDLNTKTAWWQKASGLDYPVNCITVTDDGSILAGTSGYGLFQYNSATIGFNFLALNGQIVNSIAKNKILIGSTAYYSVGTNNGLFYSTDKAQWTNVLTTSPVYSVEPMTEIQTANGRYSYQAVKTPTNTWYHYNDFIGVNCPTIQMYNRDLQQLLLAGSQGISVVSSNGKVDRQLITPDYAVGSVALFSDYSILFSGSFQNSNNLYKYSINGNLVQLSPVGLPHSNISLMTSDYNNNFFAAIDNKIYKSTNGGANWSLLVTTPTNITSLCRRPGGFFAGLASNGNQANNGKALCYNVATGVVSYSPNLWLSNNGVLSTASYRDDLYIGSAEGLYVSTDNGISWVKNNFPYPVKNMTVYVDNIAINTGSDLYYSIDKGLSWQLANSLLANRPVDYSKFGKLCIGYDGYLFLSSKSNSVPLVSTTSLESWVAPNDPQIDRTASQITEKSTALLQNYPNPFNPTTSIKYELAQSSTVLLEIFNSKGELIQQLVNENQSAGTKEVSWDASNRNSGLYFYSINVKGIDGKHYKDMKKMLLLK